MQEGKLKGKLKMTVRKPAVAGQFYGATAQECLEEIQQCMPKEPLSVDLPGPVIAGIVPHAGWIYSGGVAAMAFEAVRQSHPDVDTFVLLGAAHRYMNSGPAVYDRGAWETPLGLAAIDEALASELVDLGARGDRDAHRDEHSIEVQVPFIQHLFPNAKIVPVMVPVAGFDSHFGTRLGRLLAKLKDKRVVCIASTDLTHYGPRYGFCPEGVGPAALQWAREVNDQAFIDVAIKMDAEALVEAALHMGNACGPSAAATAIAAAHAMGRDKGVLLAHTTSNDILMERFGQSSDESVGYAAIVY